MSGSLACEIGGKWRFIYPLFWLAWLNHSGRMNSETISHPFAAEPIPAPAVLHEVLTYSVAETAQVLGVSEPTIYRLVSRRLLRPMPGLRHKRFSKRQVLAYVDAGLPGSAH